MALFRLPLVLNRKLRFWRLMGCGKNGTFDIMPDLRQWALLVVMDVDNAAQPAYNKAWSKKLLGRFITGYFSFFRARTHVLVLQPRVGKGFWNKKEVFGDLPIRLKEEWSGEMAVLTRATIRLSRARHFWRHVDQVARHMAEAPGFITSYGIGEVPWIKQATFSLWKNQESMTQFAYRNQEHVAVIRKTHAEKWYSEEMFVRFLVLAQWRQ